MNTDLNKQKESNNVYEKEGMGMFVYFNKTKQKLKNGLKLKPINTNIT